MTAKLENFIDSYCEELKPTRRLQPPFTRSLVYLGAIISASAAYMTYFGMHQRFLGGLAVPEVVLSLSLGAMSFYFASLLLLRKSVPGLATPMWMKLVFASSLGSWLGLLAITSTDFEVTKIGWGCGLATAKISIIPFTVLLFAARRAFSTDSLKSTLLLSGATSIFSASICIAICRHMAMLHILLPHLGVASLCGLFVFGFVKTFKLLEN